MEYLYRQFLQSKNGLKKAIKLENILPIKFYIQTLMCNCIVNLLPPGSTILEVGCGGSLTIHMLNKLGFDCYALDYSNVSLKFTRLLCKYFNSSVKVLKADSFSLPFFTKSFEYIFSVGLIEHYPKYEQEILIKEMARCSKRFVHIEVPNYVRSSAFYHIYSKDSSGHYEYNLNSLMGLIKADIIEYGGRGVFTVSERLNENKEHKKFVMDIAPTTNRANFTEKDIKELCRLEEHLSTQDRILYGYQIYAIGDKGIDK